MKSDKKVSKLQATPVKRASSKSAKKTSSMVVFMKTVIFLMFIMLAILVAKWHMNNNIVSNDEVVSVPTTEHKVDEVVRPVVNTVPNSGLMNRVSELEKQLDIIMYRAWVTALATNENANINKYMAEKYHQSENQEYLTLDKKWKLNKIPSTQILTEEEKKDLAKGSF